MKASIKAAFTRDGASDNERGLACYRSDDFQGAYEYFKRAIEANPRNAVYYVNRSAANLQLSKLADSYADACRALELNSRLARAYLRKGQVLLKKGEPLLAMKTFTDGLSHATGAKDQTELEAGMSEANTRAQFLSMAGVPFQDPGPINPPKRPTSPPPASPTAQPSQAARIPASQSLPTVLASAPSASVAAPTAKADPGTRVAPAADEKDSEKHWSAKILDTIDAIASPNRVGGSPRVSKSTSQTGNGMESLYSPGFLEKHSLNFSSMRDNWLGVVPQWVKGGDPDNSIYQQMLSSQSTKQEMEEKEGRKEEDEEVEEEEGSRLTAGRCIHPIDQATNELVTLDGFLSYEYENNRMFELLNAQLIGQDHEMMEVIGRLDAARKEAEAAAPSCVFVALLLPQDVTLVGQRITIATLMAHFAVVRNVKEVEDSDGADKKVTGAHQVFESLSGAVFGTIEGSSVTVKAKEGEEEEEEEAQKAGPVMADDVEGGGVGKKAEKRLHVLRTHLFRMPGLGMALNVMLVSEPLWVDHSPAPPPANWIVIDDLPMNPVERFWCKMEHPAAAKLSASLAKFISRLPRATNLTADGQRDRIATFLDEFEKDLRACPLWLGAQEDELLCALEAVNKRVLSDLYHFIFPKISDGQADLRTRSLIAALWFVIPEQLNVNRNDLDESILYTAKKELLAIDVYRSPREKVECLLNCCRIIIFQINSKGKVSSADDFLPLIILVLLHGGTAPELHRNIAYINAYCKKSEELAEAFYYLTMLESAVYFVDNLTAEQIRMPSYLFSRYLHGEIPRYRPMTPDKMLSLHGEAPAPPKPEPEPEPPLVQVPALVKEEPTRLADSLLDAIEDESRGDDNIVLHYIADKSNMSSEGLPLQVFNDASQLRRLLSEYQQLAAALHDLTPSAISFSSHAQP